MYVSGTYINFGKKCPKKRHHLEDTHSEGKIKKPYKIQKWKTNTLTGLIWLRMSVSGGI